MSTLKPRKFIAPLFLPESLESDRAYLTGCFDEAIELVYEFAASHGWLDHVLIPFIESAEIFDDKKTFRQRVCQVTGCSENMLCPTACGGLEQGILLAVSPGLYEEIFSAGIEEKAFTKLIAHEILHRLHIRILQNNEDAMGPMWFFEGFAVFGAGQYQDYCETLSEEMIIDLILNPSRGDYRKYGQIFRRVLKHADLHELVHSAADRNFNQSVIKLLKNY